MNKQVRILSILAAVAAVMAFSPVHTSAADTNAPAVEKKAVKPKVLPFHGTLASIDKTKMTLTVGERTFQVTSDTKITRNAKPAIFDDAVVGDMVGGAYKKSDDGKLTATTINLAVKADKVEKLEKTEKPKAPGDM